MTEKGEPQAVDLTALELDQLVGFFIGILSVKAWQYMGVQLAPGKSEVQKDMRKASTAIDCVVYLMEKLTPSLPPEESERLKAMVTDLQINYVKNA